MGENLSFSTRLQVNRKLGKPGRNLTFRGNFSYADSKNKNFSRNEITYYQSDNAPLQQRFSATPGNNWSYNLSLSYTEPLLKNFFLQINYSYNYSYNNSDRATYNFDNVLDYFLNISPDFTSPLLPENLEMYLDNNLSRYSTYRTQKHDVGVMFRYVTSEMNLNAGVNWLPQYTELDYKYLKIDDIFTRKVLDYVSPNIRFRYKWSKQTTLNINYRGTTSQPSMTDLIDIKDDSNPLRITEGNSGLKPSFSNNVNANFNTFNPDAQQGINVFLRYSNTINAITKYKHKIKSLTPRNNIVSKHQHNHHNHPLQTTKQNKISFQIKQIYNDIQSFSKQKQKTIPSIPKLNIPIGGGKNKLNTLLHHNHNHKHHIHITPKTTRTNTKIPLYHHYHYTKPLFNIPKHTNTFINTKHGIKSWITTEKTNQCNSYYLEKKKGIQTLFGSIKQSNSYDKLPTHPQHHISLTSLTQHQRPQSYIIHTQRDFYKAHLALFDKHISSTLY